MMPWRAIVKEVPLSSITAVTKFCGACQRPRMVKSDGPVDLGANVTLSGVTFCPTKQFSVSTKTPSNLELMAVPQSAPEYPSSQTHSPSEQVPFWHSMSLQGSLQAKNREVNAMAKANKGLKLNAFRIFIVTTK